MNDYPSFSSLIDCEHAPRHSLSLSCFAPLHPLNPTFPFLLLSLATNKKDHFLDVLAREHIHFKISGGTRDGEKTFLSSTALRLSFMHLRLLLLLLLSRA